MAAVLYLADDEIERECCKRMRIFRDRNNPLEVLNDIEVIERYRLPRKCPYSSRGACERRRTASYEEKSLTLSPAPGKYRSINNSCTSSPIIFT